MLLFLNKDCCCCSLTAPLSNRCGGISIIYRILRLVYASGLAHEPCDLLFALGSRDSQGHFCCYVAGLLHGAVDRLVYNRLF